jgi:hypothetical protein
MMKLALLVGLVAGCSEAVHVTVNCKTTADPAVECELKQTAGKSEVDVCWDFQITCGNGAVVKAPHSCQKVKDGGTATAKIPGSALVGFDKCEAGPGGAPKPEISNITLNGKPNEP